MARMPPAACRGVRRRVEYGMSGPVPLSRPRRVQARAQAACASAASRWAMRSSSAQTSAMRPEITMRPAQDGQAVSDDALNPDALRAAVAHMCHGGRIALLGLLPSDAAIDWRAVIFNMLTLRGIYGREMFETWYLMTSMVLSGLDIRPVITHRFAWHDYAAAFDVMASGRSGKVILDWDTGPG